MRQIPLTAIIPCKNEEENIEDAIKSVIWADEILIVDSFSTDNTVNLAKKYPVRILQREYINSASQKNRAIPEAKNDWVLILDADERIPEDLKKEISITLKAPGNDVAFWIHRRNFFMGKQIRFSGWQRDKVIRLFKRDLCHYEDKNVHSEIIAEGPVGKLRNCLEHNTYKSMDHYLQKWMRYSSWSAKDAYNRGIHPNIFHFTLKPAFRFLKHYFIDLGILDGYRGFIICSLAAGGVFMRYAKLYALRLAEKSGKRPG